MILQFSLSLLYKATILLAVGLVGDLLLRRHWIVLTSTLWNVAFLGLIVLPPAAILCPGWELPILPGEGTTEALQTIPPPASGLGFGAKLLLCIYGLGTLLTGIRLAASWRAVRRLQHRALPVRTDVWLQRFETLIQRLGLTERPIRLLHSPEVNVPMAMGAWNPAIVIPSQIIGDTRLATVSQSAIDAILIHELAHLARADFDWQLLERVVGVALWFHPLAWIAQRRSAFVRERACDEFVVYTTADAPGYAETLLSLAAMRSRARTLALGVAAVRLGTLARRLEAIQHSQGSQRLCAPRLIRVAAAGVAMLLATLLASVAVEHVKAAGNPAIGPPSIFNVDEVDEREWGTCVDDSPVFVH